MVKERIRRLMHIRNYLVEERFLEEVLVNWNISKKTDHRAITPESRIKGGGCRRQRLPRGRGNSGGVAGFTTGRNLMKILLGASKIKWGGTRDSM